MSSTTNASTQVHQTAVVSKQLRSEDRVTQTVYDDGRGRCIVASRKRPQTVRRNNAADIGRFQTCSLRRDDLLESEDCQSSRGSLRCSASQTLSRCEGLATSREVRVAQLPKCPRKVIVIPVSAKQTASNLGAEGYGLQRWAEPTPPPTPRLDRLPSPELSDLEEAPFCECDEAPMPRYCTSCKNAVRPREK